MLRYLIILFIISFDMSINQEDKKKTLNITVEFFG